MIFFVDCLLNKQSIIIVHIVFRKLGRWVSVNNTNKMICYVYLSLQECNANYFNFYVQMQLMGNRSKINPIIKFPNIRCHLLGLHM